MRQPAAQQRRSFVNRPGANRNGRHPNFCGGPAAERASDQRVAAKSWSSLIIARAIAWGSERGRTENARSANALDLSVGF